jgi:hypothetical protein
MTTPTKKRINSHLGTNDAEEQMTAAIGRIQALELELQCERVTTKNQSEQLDLMDLKLRHAYGKDYHQLNFGTATECKKTELALAIVKQQLQQVTNERDAAYRHFDELKQQVTTGRDAERALAIVKKQLQQMTNERDVAKNERDAANRQLAELKQQVDNKQHVDTKHATDTKTQSADQQEIARLSAQLAQVNLLNQHQQQVQTLTHQNALLQQQVQTLQQAQQAVQQRDQQRDQQLHQQLQQQLDRSHQLLLNLALKPTAQPCASPIALPLKK